jgi:hypothetical protein
MGGNILCSAYSLFLDDVHRENIFICGNIKDRDVQ